MKRGEAQKPRSLFKPMLLLGTMCFGLYMAPNSLERVRSVLGGVGGAGGADASLGQLLNQATPKTQAKKDPPKMIISGGKTLSPEEQARLMAQAKAMAPKPIEDEPEAEAETDTPAEIPAQEPEAEEPVKSVDDPNAALEELAEKLKKAEKPEQPEKPGTR